MGRDMLEAHGRRHAGNEQEGGSKASKIMMSPVTPHSFSGMHGKERVRADADIAGWAVGNHPDQGPENGSQLHGIAITSRIPLNDRPRAGRTVEQGSEEVETRGTTTDDNDRPAKASRERGRGRHGRAVSVDKNFSHPGMINRGGAHEGITSSGMKLTDIPKVSGEGQPGSGRF